MSQVDRLLVKKKLAQLGRITTLIVMLIAAFWAPIISNFEGLFNYLQLVLSYSVPPIVTVFLFGIFWPHARAHSAKYTLIGGHCICLIALILNINGYFHLHFTIVAPILLLVSMLIFLGTALLVANSDDVAVQSSLTWRSGKDSLALKIRPWYLQIRHIAILLVLITISIIIMFW